MNARPNRTTDNTYNNLDKRVKGITEVKKSPKKKKQCPKVTYYMISFIEHSLNDKIIEMENRLVVA